MFELCPLSFATKLSASKIVYAWTVACSWEHWLGLLLEILYIQTSTAYCNNHFSVSISFGYMFLALNMLTDKYDFLLVLSNFIFSLSFQSDMVDKAATYKTKVLTFGRYIMVALHLTFAILLISRNCYNATQIKLEC